MSDASKTTLKSCPFCGSDAIFQRTFDQVPRKHYVRCVMPLCPVMPETARFLDQFAAARAWNTREAADVAA